MGKLRLGTEELRVESFPTGDAGAGEGRVRGHSITLHTDCGCRYTENADWHHTCAWSCVDEMGATVCAEWNACTAYC